MTNARWTGSGCRGFLRAARLAAFLGTLGATLPRLSAAPAWSPPERGFTSTNPASSWELGLITGNGKFGALVYGQPADETIVLNHARLFMPLAAPTLPVQTGTHLLDLRRLMGQGLYQAAADLVASLAREQGLGDKQWTDPFVPAFDLRVAMAPEGTVRDYERSVDFSSGVAAVKWRDDRGEFVRRLFVSRADDVVALWITGPTRGSVSCNLSLAQRPESGQGGSDSERMFQEGVRESAAGAEPGWLSYHARFRREWPGSLRGYEGLARVIPKGGRMVLEGDHLRVIGADEVLVLLRIDLATGGAALDPAPRRLLTKLKPDAGLLLARATEAHGRLFNRCQLDLGGGADRRLAPEDLIAQSRLGRLSPALLEQEFDASRYAVLCSSGELFPNLQGIWNGTWGPPWSGDFTLDGNVQTALAADLSANLGECLEPFFRYLEAHLPEYRTNAARLYGCHGILLPSRASTHGLNNHFDSTWPTTFWTAGAAWAAHFYYDYYLYTGDRRFLEQRALPFMRAAARFYEDFIVEGPDGKWLFWPSYSPENNPGNSPSQAAINATMDIAAATELLRNCVAASETLNLDPDAVDHWRDMLARMPPCQINADGAVREWCTPLLEDNYRQGHASHLYALFYGLPDDIATNAPLRQAFQVAIDKRMEARREANGGGMALGLVQLGQAATSLRNAPLSYEVVDRLANGYWRPNLVSTHNPKAIFNLDVCGGLPAIILSMLVDSQPGWIDLLPTQPAEWPSGEIRGARCRGQIEIRRLAWTLRGLSVTLRSDITQRVDLRVRGKVWQMLVQLPAGKEVTFEKRAE